MRVATVCLAQIRHTTGKYLLNNIPMIAVN